MAKRQDAVQAARGRLEEVTEQLAHAEGQAEQLAADCADLIEAYARGEVATEAFNARLDEIEEAQRQNDRRRDTLATTRERVTELLGEAEHSARMDAAARELRERREQAPDMLANYLRAKAEFILQRFELVEQRKAISRLTNILGGEADDVGGPLVDWSKVNLHTQIPLEAEVADWAGVARTLDRLNVALETLGGEPVYADNAELEDTEPEAEAV